MMPSSFINCIPETAMRTIVDLPDEQVGALQQLGSRNGVSRAELVRRAVAEYLDKHKETGDDHAFGLWKRRHCDALVYENRLREEWSP